MKVFKTAMVMMVLTFSSILWAQGVSKASLDFPVVKASKFRCTIQQTSTGLWDLTVLAKDASRHIIFNYLYSVHPEVKKSMNDCHAWLKAVKKKAIEEARLKQSGGQAGQKEGNGFVKVH